MQLYNFNNFLYEKVNSRQYRQLEKLLNIDKLDQPIIDITKRYNKIHDKNKHKLKQFFKNDLFDYVKVNKINNPETFKEKVTDLLNSLENSIEDKKKVKKGGDVYPKLKKASTFEDKDVLIIPIYNKKDAIQYREFLEEYLCSKIDWCIAYKNSGNMFNSYRFGKGYSRLERVFYYVLNKNHIKNKDPKNTVVAVSVETNGETFGYSPFDNSGDSFGLDIKGLSNKMGLNMDKYLKVLVPKDLTDDERGDFENYTRISWREVKDNPYKLEKWVEFNDVEKYDVELFDLVSGDVKHIMLGNGFMDVGLLRSSIEGKYSDNLFGRIRHYLYQREVKDKVEEYAFLLDNNIDVDFILDKMFKFKDDLYSLDIILRYSKNPDLIIDKIIEGGYLEYIAKKRGLIVVLDYSKNPDSIINKAIEERYLSDVIKKNGLYDILRYSKNPDLVIDKIIEEGYLGDIIKDSYTLGTILKNSKNPDLATDKIIEEGYLEDVIKNNGLHIILNYSKNPDLTIGKIIEEGYLNEIIKSYSLDTILGYSKNSDSIIHKIIEDGYLVDIIKDSYMQDIILQHSTKPEYYEKTFKEYKEKNGIFESKLTHIKDFNSFL